MVLDFEVALAIVIEQAYALRSRRHGSASPALTEQVPLLEAAGRVLAEPIRADRDQPPFDRSTRDGFAVQAAEFSSGARLKVIGLVRAGEAWPGAALEPGQAIEIMTGAPMPAGANAVAMLEHVIAHDGDIKSNGSRTLRVGDNIVAQATEARAADIVAAGGSLVGAAEIAEAATCGMLKLIVYSKPSVAIVATGDELVDIEQVPNAHQIRNSNTYGISAMVEAAGGLPLRLPIAEDTLQSIRDRLKQATTSDLLLFSGGVSMGKYDLIEEVLAEFGAEFFFTGVMMQPGKPLVFGRLPRRVSTPGEEEAPERYFFGLPGNPVSTQVTFHCFVEPFLRVMCGEDISGPRFAQATLSEGWAGKLGLTRILPARLSGDVHGSAVKLVSWHGSGDLAANARANCYAVLPADQVQIETGTRIAVLLR